jgi:multidrug transporter EmrE-like cation transporter
MKTLLLLVLSIVLIKCICIFCMKKGKQNNTAELCTLGVIGFLLIGYMFNQALSHGQLGKITLILQGFSLLAAFIMGYVWFEEKWNHRKTIAILLSFIAIGILYTEELDEIEIK